MSLFLSLSSLMSLFSIFISPLITLYLSRLIVISFLIRLYPKKLNEREKFISIGAFSLNLSQHWWPQKSNCKNKLRWDGQLTNFSTNSNITIGMRTIEHFFVQINIKFLEFTKETCHNMTLFLTLNINVFKKVKEKQRKINSSKNCNKKGIARKIQVNAKNKIRGQHCKRIFLYLLCSKNAIAICRNQVDDVDSFPHISPSLPRSLKRSATWNKIQ